MHNPCKLRHGKRLIQKLKQLFCQCCQTIGSGHGLCSAGNMSAHCRKEFVVFTSSNTVLNALIHLLSKSAILPVNIAIRNRITPLKLWINLIGKQAILATPVAAIGAVTRALVSCLMITAVWQCAFLLIRGMDMRGRGLSKLILTCSLFSTVMVSGAVSMPHSRLPVC